MRHVTEDHDAEQNKALSEPVFLILASLASQSRHGYGLMKDVREISNHRVTLSTGTLYGALRRLLEEGWIERFEQEDQSRDKQAYKLTATGRRRLESDITRMEQLAHLAAIRIRESEA
jgi:DNA-binding PadR family transcriptional regulator